jgi:hypothetical protein
MRPGLAGDTQPTAPTIAIAVVVGSGTAALALTVVPLPDGCPKSVIQTT